MKSAIYVRQSQDRSGEGLGVTRQEALCRERCASLGWNVVDVYRDNDASAYTGQLRQAYRRLLDDIRNNAIEAVVVYDLDRLHRRPIELEEFIEIADRRGIALASVGGDVDLSTDNGRLFARIKGAVARSEVERKSERQKAAARDRAMRGQLHVANRRSFGYELDGKTANAVEKAATAEAAQWLLDGVSLKEVARRWNAAGLTTATGKHWAGELISQFFVNPRLVGIRTYQREPVIINGEPVRGEWEPLLDEETWQALRALLTDPRRRTTRAAQHQLLLSGVAICGVCGANIQSGGLRQGNARRGYRYRCSFQTSHVNRYGNPVDTFVTDVLLRRLEQPDISQHLHASQQPVDLAALGEESTHIHQRLEGLSEAYADGSIDLGQLRAGSERLHSQLTDLEAQAAASQRSATTAKLATASDVRSMWDGLDLDVQRTVIRELMGIRLFGPGAGIRYVSDEHVKITWL